LVKNKFLTILNEFYKISNLLQREEAMSVNQAFNRDHQEACAHQTNMEEAQNGASRTLVKPMNNKDVNEN